MLKAIGLSSGNRGRRAGEWRTPDGVDFLFRRDGAADSLQAILPELRWTLLFSPFHMRLDRYLFDCRGAFGISQKRAAVTHATQSRTTLHLSVSADTRFLPKSSFSAFNPRSPKPRRAQIGREIKLHPFSCAKCAQSRSNRKISFAGGRGAWVSIHRTDSFPAFSKLWMHPTPVQITSPGPSS